MYLKCSLILYTFLKVILTFYSSDCMSTISKICRLFQNYPELLQGFGMFLPPSINLQVQTAGRFIMKANRPINCSTQVKTENGDKQDDCEWQKVNF